MMFGEVSVNQQHFVLDITKLNLFHGHDLFFMNY